jgi:hypothetical protein
MAWQSRHGKLGFGEVRFGTGVKVWQLGCGTVRLVETGNVTAGQLRYGKAGHFMLRRGLAVKVC